MILPVRLTLFRFLVFLKLLQIASFHPAWAATAPFIYDQTSLSTPEELALTITLSDLLVADSDSDYPDDFTLFVQDGTNYSKNSNTITPNPGFTGTLTMSVSVNDSGLDAKIYNIKWKDRDEIEK